MLKGATLGILNQKQNFLERGRNFVTENDVYKSPWNTNQPITLNLPKYVQQLPLGVYASPLFSNVISYILKYIIVIIDFPYFYNSSTRFMASVVDKQILANDMKQTDTNNESNPLSKKLFCDLTKNIFKPSFCYL